MKAKVRLTDAFSGRSILWIYLTITKNITNN